MSNDSTDSAEKDCSVRVAVRIRPQNPRELIDMCRICTTVTPGEPQIVMGLDKAFTFDCVFDANSTQSEIYANCVEKLVEGALRGYNATVLAYGQTGSGKTYTMGTGFDSDSIEQQQGIIPRAVRHIFDGINNIHCQDAIEDESRAIQSNIKFSVGAQFIELYNEEIIDLLDPYNKGRSYKIHEDGGGQITVSGITIKPINNPQDALKCLKQGALARTTASTQMNDQSSRSHALFTILIRRQRIMSSTETGLPDGDLETLTSKFHFVDLAGSERLKRTGATGERAREGISINCGLLALGNCISALGDKAKKATHVPYRDSKLTRLLQDSLGGNSETLMIACISPSDRDFMETLNTLKYANRARNIKNKVQLNQDQSSRTITQLRREIAALQMELLEYKQGKRLTDAEGNSSISDTYHENTMLTIDNKCLKQRLKAMQETINVLTENNTQLKLEKEANGWGAAGDLAEQSVATIVAGYIGEIEKLQAKLIESEEMYQQLKKSGSSKDSPRSNIKSNMNFDDPEDVLNLAKRKVEKEREALMSRSLPGYEDDANNCNIIEQAASDSDESDTESDEKTKEIEDDLNDINSDIEIKSKLIEQLELSQQRMQLMRVHYEEKLNVLNHKITNTQKERDEILANMSGNHGNQPSDKVKKVRDEYERKLNDMQSELKRLQQAQREHARQQREMQTQEIKLQNLRSELSELKSIKTRLMRKMAEQTNRHREEETRKTREIAQLRKLQRRQENTVKTLQAQVHMKEQILKRKNEEVSALRRDQRTRLSQRVAGRKALATTKTDNKQVTAAYNSRTARHRWDHINRAMTRAARNKQAVMQLEKELERLVSEREVLCTELANVRSRQLKARNAELANEEDSIKSNLNYVQENIAQVQQSIMELEENKEQHNKSEELNLQNVIAGVHNIEEAKFLLERLTENAISATCNAAVNEVRLLEHESLLKELKQESGIQQQLLHHFLTKNTDVQISDLFESLSFGGNKINNLNQQISGSQKSLVSNGTYDIPNDIDDLNANNAGDTRKSRSRSVSPTPTIDVSSDRNGKIRQRTALPQELLFGESSENGNDVMTRSYTQHESMTSNYQPLIRVPSAPGSLKQVLNAQTKTQVTETTTAIPIIAPASPRTARRAAVGTIKDTTTGFVSNLRDDEFIGGLAPQSPPVYRRMISREDTNNGDVFSRLGAGQQGPLPGGNIHRVTGKIKAGVPLYCTHTVSGHNNAVLSIQVEENSLYTAAADRTVKVWDLVKETAVHCLSLHPGPVIAVQNDPMRRLLISASGPFARIWDLRMSNIKPIKTLSSTGHVLSGNTNVTGLTPGESPITALCLGVSGNLYMAASDKVRIWDLNSFTCIGKLSGGHQAAVMCVTAWEGDGNMDFVATGSKDHYVKVFEVSRTGGVTYPLLNLEPPHYDGVQALVVAPNAVGADAELFSGSRDSGIKRWDLKSGELKQSLNNAHKGWVSGMAISGDILLSGCRGGIIRLWNVKTCESLAEMKTDLMINDIVAVDQRVFTASSSGEVRIWRFSPQENLLLSNMSSSLEKK